MAHTHHRSFTRLLARLPLHRKIHAAIQLKAEVWMHSAQLHIHSHTHTPSIYKIQRNIEGSEKERARRREKERKRELDPNNSTNRHKCEMTTEMETFLWLMKMFWNWERTHTHTSTQISTYSMPSILMQIARGVHIWCFWPLCIADDSHIAYTIEFKTESW